MNKRTPTDRQQRFIMAYLGEARCVGVRAAKLAGYEGTDESLRVTAARLLANANVRARIDEVLQAEALSAAEVLRELTAVATAPTTHFMQVIQPADEESGQPMMVRQDYGAKVKSLELLGKFHKLFTDKTEHLGKDGEPLVFTIAIARADDDGDPQG